MSSLPAATNSRRWSSTASERPSHTSVHGYNKLGVLQRCWVHLLRDAKELAQLNADRPETAAWVEALRALYLEAKAFSLASGELSPNERLRQRERRRLERLAAQLARPYVNDPDAPQRALAQRIIKHRHELFVLVRHPEVAGDNNLAERSLRPAASAPVMANKPTPNRSRK